MGILLKNLSVPVTDRDPDSHIRRCIKEQFGIDSSEIQGFKIVKKSLDARRKRQIVYRYRLELALKDDRRSGKIAKTHEDLEVLESKAMFDPLQDLDFKDKSSRHPAVVIGSGPAGIFAAHTLVEAGQKVVIVERGEAVEDRLRSVNRLRRNGEFSEKSNYCFGEGGAGTFSDGKLSCGRNHVLIKYLFQQWVRYGAPESILYDAHPHIGTDYLLQICKNMRADLEARGAEFLFNSQFLSFETGTQSRYKVKLSGGVTLDTDHLVIAIGHSARDTYRYLYDVGLAMGPKPFAIGARFEHPQDVIDQIQFGSCQLLPAAEYKLASKAGNRGVWTFCMCPGGQLLPTNAQAEHLAINGMSYHARNSGFANAAVVVNVNREDFYKGHVLDGVAFQEQLEQKAFIAGGGGYHSPAQRLKDFLVGRESRGELISTYKPGLSSYPMDQLLPNFVVDALRGALTEYNKKMNGYISDHAVVAGVETKTSAPIVMMRDKSLQSISHPGIFPCGEGAGFAGGIVSASLDGLRVGRAALEEGLTAQLIR